MSKRDYTTSITVPQSSEEVFKAICNVAAWWQGRITGSADKLGDEFVYAMEPHHITKQRVVELDANKKITWLVTESKINFVSDKNEWLNTKIIFDIEEVDGGTKLTFTHQGLLPSIECYGGCSNAWTALIEKSLYSLITTGKGVNVFSLT